MRGRVLSFAREGRETVAGACSFRALAVAARAFGRPRFCVEGSSLLVSRGAKPSQRRALEGSGGTGVGFWTSAVLRGKVVTFALEGRETVARAILQRAVAVAARAFCVEGSSVLLSRGAKPWHGRALEGSGGSGVGFWTSAVLRGKVLTFGLEGRETVAEACSRGLWRYRRRLLDVRGFAWKGPHFWSRGARNQGRGVF